MCRSVREATIEGCLSWASLLRAGDTISGTVSMSNFSSSCRPPFGRAVRDSRIGSGAHSGAGEGPVPGA